MGMEREKLCNKFIILEPNYCSDGSGRPKMHMDSFLYVSWKEYIVHSNDLEEGRAIISQSLPHEQEWQPNKSLKLSFGQKCSLARWRVIQNSPCSIQLSASQFGGFFSPDTRNSLFDRQQVLSCFVEDLKHRRVPGCSLQGCSGRHWPVEGRAKCLLRWVLLVKGRQLLPELPAGPPFILTSNFFKQMSIFEILSPLSCAVL